MTSRSDLIEIALRHAYDCDRTGDFDFDEWRHACEVAFGPRSPGATSATALNHAIADYRANGSAIQSVADVGRALFQMQEAAKDLAERLGRAERIARDAIQLGLATARLHFDHAGAEAFEMYAASLTALAPSADDMRTIRATHAAGLTVGAEPLTVGAFLAFDHVAEFCVDGEWWQVRPSGVVRMWRTNAYGGPKWSWWMDNGLDVDAYADLPCRLVPISSCNADPATRGG